MINRSALVAFSLAGLLALSACGASSSSSATSSAAASASASASSSASAHSAASASSSATTGTSASASASLSADDQQKLPDAVKTFYETMRGGAQQQLSAETNTLLSKVNAKSNASAQQVADQLQKDLTDDERAKLLKELQSGADPLYKLVDHAGLTQAQDIVLSLYMISNSETLFQQTATMDDSQLKVNVDLSKVIFKGDTAAVPVAAMSTALQQSAQASASASPTPTASQDPNKALTFKWVDGQWKVYGQKYFELLNSN